MKTQNQEMLLSPFMNPLFHIILGLCVVFILNHILIQHVSPYIVIYDFSHVMKDKCCLDFISELIFKLNRPTIIDIK